MAKLIAKSASEDLLPISVGSLTLRDATPDRMTAIAPWPGAGTAAAKLLKTAGFDWPSNDRAVQGQGGVCIWSGRDQAFLTGVAPPDGLAAHAALTDISDGWTALCLSGPDAVSVLARLVAIDLSPRAFPQGATARTGLGHMMVLIHHGALGDYMIFIFRSMTAFAVHEIEVAMKAVVARGALR